MDTLRLSTLEGFSIWYFVLPPDAKQGPQTPHVEGVELFGVWAVDSPCLACIEQGCENNCPVHIQFGFEPQAPALPDLDIQSAEGRTGSGYSVGHLLVDVDRARQSAAKIDELVCYCESLAIDGDVGFSVGICRCWLVHDFGLFGGDGGTKVVTGFCEQVHAFLHI